MENRADTVGAGRDRVEKMGWKPRNVVWEMTLACNLRCGHCGSSAGKPREHELDTAECLDVAAQLADLGAELVTLSGGEPTIRSDWDRIAALLSSRGVRVNMVTNGVYGGAKRCREIADRASASGMCNVGLSIDGPRQIHETIRGNGTFRATLESIQTFVGTGMRAGVLTTVNRLNLPHLEEIRDIAIDSGATLWRLQLAKPMGNLKQKDDWVISPEEVLSLVPRLALLKKAGGIAIGVGDSIGYYGPHDKTLRGWGWRQRSECWQGCQAGLQALGIESDGSIKGCLSLQAKWGDKDPFVEGSLRQAKLADLWYMPGIFSFNRDFSVDSLTGSCAGCRYRGVCRGGARCVSSSFTGSLGEDPYCYYSLSRAAQQDRPFHVGRAAATAAAAIALSVNVLSCDLGGGSKNPITPSDATEVAPDECCLAEYGIDLVGGPDQQVQPDVGEPDAVTPDIQAPDTCCQPEYGVFPDVVTQDNKPADATTQDTKPSDAIDCSQVCCECDYGILPDEVIKECCTPPADVVTQDTKPADVVSQDTKPADAIDCSKVCCECEYGIIPDDVWKECCDPCADACCECDYGEPPPPECCK